MKNRELFPIRKILQILWGIHPNIPEGEDCGQTARLAVFLAESSGN